MRRPIPRKGRGGPEEAARPSQRRVRICPSTMDDDIDLRVMQLVDQTRTSIDSAQREYQVAIFFFFFF